MVTIGICDDELDVRDAIKRVCDRKYEGREYRV